MKRKAQHVLGCGILLLFAAVLVVIAVNRGQTRQDIANRLRKELSLGEDASIVCVSELVENGDSLWNALSEEENALLWFSIGEEGARSYRAVVCHALKNGKYQLKQIKEPVTCAQDIVLVPMRRTVILINNPDCRWITINGGATSKTEISAEEIPYLYILNDSGGLRIDFLDADGNPLH